jgi:hypothetical protein
MSNDSFIQGLVAAFVAADHLVVWASIAGVAALVVLGVVLAVRRVWIGAAACFALAAAPYALHAMLTARQTDGLDRRAAYLAGLERTPLTADHPRVLEVQMGRGIAAEVLWRGWFDAVHVHGQALWPNDEPGARVIYRWKRTPACVAQAEATRAGRRAEGEAARADCVTEENVRWTGPLPDAVILMRDGETTLRTPGGNHWMGGALELRVRRGGRDALVDYWETPYVKRPASPALGQRMLERRSEPPEERDPLDFLRDALPGAEGPPALRR